MKTKQINIYKFDELNDKVKQKVLNRFRDNNDYPFLEEELNESLKELLQEYKIKALDTPKLLYSLGYSQGDGVMFEGNFEFNGVEFSVKHDGHYYHSNSKTIDYDDYDGDNLESDLKEMVYNDFNFFYKEICDKMKKLGYDSIENDDSEQTIKDNIDANDYYFTENGDITSEN